MKREVIEQYMIQNKIEQIDLVYNEYDQLGVFCRLKNGKLYDYTDHVVSRKIDIWGYLKWNNGQSTRISWTNTIQ